MLQIVIIPAEVSLALTIYIRTEHNGYQSKRAKHNEV